MKRFGQVERGSTEWTVQRVPKERVAVTRSSLEILQAENALLKRILDEARHLLEAAKRSDDVTVAYGVSATRMTQLLREYDGWTESPELRDALVEKLLQIADELGDGQEAEVQQDR